jgi:hypothetical protein
MLWIDLGSGKRSRLRRQPRSSVVIPAVADQPPAELNNATFAQWRDRIRPKSTELCFATVNWLPALWDGVIAAQKQDMPILLWAMNGHPLACT